MNVQRSKGVFIVVLLAILTVWAGWSSYRPKVPSSASPSSADTSSEQPATIPLYKDQAFLKNLTEQDLLQFANPVSQDEPAFDGQTMIRVQDVINNEKITQLTYIIIYGADQSSYEISAADLARSPDAYLLMSTNAPAWKLIRKAAGTTGKGNMIIRQVSRIQLSTKTTRAAASPTADCVTPTVVTSLEEALSDPLATCALQLGDGTLSSLPDGLSKLTNLRTLLLGHNAITSFGDELSGLAKLTTLNLSSNELTALPAAIGALTNLTVLKLGRNQIESLPATIGNLSNVTLLELDNNALTTIPKEIGNLARLEELGLANNKLTHLPDEIIGLTSLKELELTGNPLSPQAKDRISRLLPHVQIKW